MKKLFSNLLLCLCTAAVVLTVQRVRKHEKKPKHKQPCAEQLSMQLPTHLPFQNIQGQNREQLIEEIQAFPTASYQLFSVRESGRFYLDDIDDVIKSVLRQGIVWEEPIQKLIRQHTRPDSTVLDIGAHIGTHTLTLARAVGAQGRVVAFEPQPKIFRELFLNMAANDLNNISFYSAGVGDHEGVIELAPFTKGNEGGTMLCGGTGHFVPLLTIDSLHLSDVSLMKIDVESMENQVLDGARETILANHPIIIIEIMGGHVFGTASKEVRQKILYTIDKLEQLGYQVTHLGDHDWLATPLPLTTKSDN